MNRFLVRAATGAVLTTAIVAAALITASPVFAADPTCLAVTSIPRVLDEAPTWLMGILAAVATLSLTIRGVRYVTAGGNPGEVEKAKGPVKSVGIGYAVAARTAAVVIIALAVVALAGSPAFADQPAPVPLAVKSLQEVIDGLTGWIVGILAAVATLFLTIGGVRYLMAGGDPSEVERAKGSLKSAGIGYALALLAPVILTALKGILGA